jgi:hypothetical protein
VLLFFEEWVPSESEESDSSKESSLDEVEAFWVSSMVSSRVRIEVSSKSIVAKSCADV